MQSETGALHSFFSTAQAPSEADSPELWQDRRNLLQRFQPYQMFLWADCFSTPVGYLPTHTRASAKAWASFSGQKIHCLFQSWYWFSTSYLEVFRPFPSTSFDFLGFFLQKLKLVKIVILAIPELRHRLTKLAQNWYPERTIRYLFGYQFSALNMPWRKRYEVVSFAILAI